MVDETSLNCILNLQSITEKLLFSTNIPKEIQDKYNYLKQQTFESLGLQFNPGVSTYTPTNLTSSERSDANYSTASTLTHPQHHIDYNSTGGLKRSQDHQLFTQLEEIMKSMNEHLANMTKGIVLEEDNSFIQESLSKKFLESTNSHHFSQVPKEFLNRVDSIKHEFDGSIRKLVDHFNQQRADLQVQCDRKLDLLKQECHRYKIEVQNVKAQQERQCMCKVYEETIDKLKSDHMLYMDKLKQKYEAEIYEIRAKNSQFNLEAYRDKIFTDLHSRVLMFVQERHGAYLNSYCTDHSLNLMQIDPVELLFYIVQRLQGDNNWLVDKLAEVQEEKRRIMDRSQILEEEHELLNTQLFTDIIEQTMNSTRVIEQFQQSREQLMTAIKNDKENVPYKKHNYNSSSSNLRESLQSTKSLNKSQSGHTLSMKYQHLMKPNGKDSHEKNYQTNTVDIDSLERSNVLGESNDYYRDYNK